METRIKNHPILGVPEKGRLVTFTFDGRKMQGYEGEPIAAALKAAGVMVHRYTKKEHNRGAFFVPSAGARIASWLSTANRMSAPV